MEYAEASPEPGSQRARDRCLRAAEAHRGGCEGRGRAAGAGPPGRAGPADDRPDEDDRLLAGAGRGRARGDAGRRVRVYHGRGRGPVRRRIRRDARPVLRVRRRPGHRHPHQRGHDRRRGGGRGDGRHAADRRDHVRRLHSAGDGPDREPGRQEPLYVRRQDQRAHGHPDRRRRGTRDCGAPLAEPRGALDALPRHLRRHAFDAVRREGPAQGGDSRRQPGHVHRAQDALRRERPGPRAGLRDPARRGRHQAARQGPDARHLLAHGPPGAGGSRGPGEGRDRRRSDRPALAQAAGPGHASSTR